MAETILGFEVLEVWAAINYLIGFGYFVLSLQLVIMPIFSPTIRTLGIYWLLISIGSILFLTCCGIHHWHMANHAYLLEGHITVWSFFNALAQPLGAFVAATVVVVHYDTLLYELERTLNNR